jgi:lysozyme
MTMLGIDIASHQGPDFPFVAAYKEGYRFATPKVSGGKGYQNEFRAAQVNGARAAGMQTALYHYMWEPENRYGSGTPQEEFANFKAAIGNLYTDATQLGLDIEESRATFDPQPNMTEWIVAFQDLCVAEYGRFPVLYLGTYFIQQHNLYDQRLTRSPLWLPSWQNTVPTPNYWLPWTELKIWQYASNATVGGVSPIDVDKFFGTEDEFKALGKVATAPPTGPARVTTPATDWEGEGEIVSYEQVVVVRNGGMVSQRREIDATMQPWVQLSKP